LAASVRILDWGQVKDSLLRLGLEYLLINGLIRKEYRSSNLIPGPIFTIILLSKSTHINSTDQISPIILRICILYLFALTLENKGFLNVNCWFITYHVFGSIELIYVLLPISTAFIKGWKLIRLNYIQSILLIIHWRRFLSFSTRRPRISALKSVIIHFPSTLHVVEILFKIGICKLLNISSIWRLIYNSLIFVLSFICLIPIFWSDNWIIYFSRYFPWIHFGLVKLIIVLNTLYYTLTFLKQFFFY